MLFVCTVLAFTLQGAFWGMSKVLTFMPTSFPKLAKLLCLCKCLPLLCYTLILSLLLIGVQFGLNLVSFWGCLKLVLCAFICFIKSLKPSKTRSSRFFAYPLTNAWDLMDESTRFLFLLLSHWCLHYTQRNRSSQWEVFAHLKRFMASNWSSLQKKVLSYLMCSLFPQLSGRFFNHSSSLMYNIG
jgi:hypothetical protein